MSLSNFDNVFHKIDFLKFEAKMRTSGKYCTRKSTRWYASSKIWASFTAFAQVFSPHRPRWSFKYKNKIWTGYKLFAYCKRFCITTNTQISSDWKITTSALVYYFWKLKHWNFRKWSKTRTDDDTRHQNFRFNNQQASGFSQKEAHIQNVIKMQNLITDTTYRYC